jgi:hypothetical protein
MSDIDTMTIKDARDAVQRGKEIETMLGAAPTALVSHGQWDAPEKQIVILDRGFVYVGDVKIDGDWVLIANAQNVRRWGTAKGLGELAAKGPQPSTVLDPTGTVRAPLRALIGLIQCTASSWTK